MMTAKQKTLKLVTEQTREHVEAGRCEACADLKRQLEHIRMCLHATLLAAQPKASRNKQKSTS